MQLPKPYAVALGLLMAASLACGSAGASTPSVAERATGLALTAAAVLTTTAEARPATAESEATPTPMPSPTPAPSPFTTATTAPPIGDTATPGVSATPCENDSAFVSDVNVPDGTHFAQGAAFVKTWRLRNDGVCTWTAAYTFRHVAGQGMGSTSISLPNEAPAGATVDLSVPLTAPSANGTFKSEWQLHSPAGEPFGSKPFVEIIVP